MNAPTNLPEHFGRYRILKQLGQGGMGAVYLAEDTELDRRVALKVPHLDPEDGQEVIDRFRREAKAAAQLHHPDICPVFDVGQVEGTPYLTMPFLEGVPLTRSTDKPWEPREAVSLVTRLARAMQHAHEKGIVHRDLKPSNVLLRPDGRPVIMDFGLARSYTRASQRFTTPGRILGSPSYMAPEQWQGDGQAQGPATDVYGLGVILYELLTGQVPFRGEVWQIMAQVMTKEAPRPSTLRTDLGTRADAVCLKALAKEPLHRYPSMAEFAAALDGYLRGLENPFLPALPTPGNGPPLPREIVNSLGMRLVLIPAGKFLMGSPEGETGRRSDETQHEVEIAHPFYLGIYPVTQVEYEQVMGENPSSFSATGRGKDAVKGLDTRDFPVERVSWHDAGEFCEKLSALENGGPAGGVYRLPSEAEWEYSCREGGSRGGPFHFGDILTSALANFNGNFPYSTSSKGPNLGRTTKVGSYPPNGLGICDMHGNVWEWCADWFGPYPGGPVTDPTGPRTGTARVLRGGSWDGNGHSCRAAYRGSYGPGLRDSGFGFRVVLCPPPGTS